MAREPAPPTDDRFNLSRFVAAQARNYDQAFCEIEAGQKVSHWMWYVFPQLAGLGNSDMARRYAISGVPEATAYMEHPLLGARLLACCEALLRLRGRTAHEIFGSPDDLKLRSSMTLFSQVSRSQALCHSVLDRYFAGKPDERTLSLLRGRV